MITGQKIFSLLKALAVSYIITAILLLITAFLMYKLGLGDTVIRYCSFHYEWYDPYLCRRDIDECDPVSGGRNAWRDARLETSFS